ncbi:uncharacterized protein LOC123246130 [Gracilinanus agilis]|uniref:uncharacterized protein LOC123246130 n=1 Tax=Gracilinanus agilis TaxID=191870 RepID=UPI001CFC7DC4|nr:uncharacterized protein LOC123246130 [Gracilinanus agilis]
MTPLIKLTRGKTTGHMSTAYLTTHMLALDEKKKNKTCPMRGRDSCISSSGPLGSLPAPRILLLLPPQPEPESELELEEVPGTAPPFPSAASQHSQPIPPVAFWGHERRDSHTIQAPGKRVEKRPSLILGLSSGITRSSKPLWIPSRWKTLSLSSSTCHSSQADQQDLVGQHALPPSPHPWAWMTLNLEDSSLRAISQHDHLAS